jgi:hypothetical protein
MALSGALILLLAPAVRADDEADAKAILAQAIKAQGGADKLAAIKATITKGKGKVHVNSMDLDYTSTSSIQGTEKLRIEIDTEVMGMKFTILQIFNKDKGWISVGGMTMDADKDTLQEFKEQMYAQDVAHLVKLTGKDFKLTPVGEVKVAGKEAVGLRVESKGHRDINLFFDKKTNLLVKIESRQKDPQTGKEFNSETFLSDYKEKDGIQVPHKIEIKRDGEAFLEGEVTDYKVEKELSDTLFEKP